MPATNVQWPIPLIRFPTLWPGQMGVEGTDNDRGERAHCTGEVFYVDPNFPVCQTYAMAPARLTRLQLSRRL